MNLYLRYFDNETLVYSVEEALDFLRSIPDIELTPDLERDIREYAQSDMSFPKRYKVRSRVYFIIIKTLAESMLDFKQKKSLRSQQTPTGTSSVGVQQLLTEEKPGWYEGEFDFKRVVMARGTGKFEYRDTHFVARCKAMSGIDCYDRIVEYLRGRVDSRSQFPSAKGKSFRFRYLGMWK